MVSEIQEPEDPEEIYKMLLEEARNDPNIIGFFLSGSRGKGLFTQYSDYDVVYVISDDKIAEYKERYPRYKYKQMELLLGSLSDFRKAAQWGTPGDWGRYDSAWITATVDKTGEIQQILDETGRIPPDAVKTFIEKSLDSYINYFYRSLKCFRDGYDLGARLELNIEIECLFNLLFALHDGRLKPFYKYLVWELEIHPLEKVPWTAGEFIDKITRILDDADVEIQREIFLMVEKLCRDEGYGYYIDGWDGTPDKEDFALMRTFKHQKTIADYRASNIDVPIIEFDPDPHARIEPAFATENIDVPEHCIVCFFKDVIDDLLENPDTRMIARDGSVMGDFPVYETVIDSTRIAFFHPGVGAPLCTGLLEFVIQLGCKKFIAVGSAGAVQSNLRPYQIVIPVSAVRDEGTSYHYLPPSREVASNPVVVKIIETELKRRNINYIKAKTWTTDAYYRETPAKIELRRNEGCATVEMEAAAFFAVAQFRNVLFGQMLLCGDDISGESWKVHDDVDPKALRRDLFYLAADICFAL